MSYSSHTPAAPWSCWQVRSTARATSMAWTRRARTSAERVGRCGVEPPQREVGQLAEPGDGDGGVGQLELHGLEGGDRLAELDAAVHVLDGQLDGPVARCRGRCQAVRARWSSTSASVPARSARPSPDG